MAVFAVDAGGTRIKLGLVQGGKVLARTSIDARSDEGLAPALPRIAAALRGLATGVGCHLPPSPLPSGREGPGVRGESLAGPSPLPPSPGGERDSTSPSPIEGLGMAFPSLIDGDRIVGDVGKYRDAEGLDLAAWAWDEFRAPFAVDNDARMATIGEWRHGAGQGSSDMVMVTLGTGIGTGVVSEGRVLRGRHGAAGILGGHMTARIGGRLCPCGNLGCWETEASTAALPLIGEGFTDYAAVFASPDATWVREHSLEVWSALAVSLIHAYDPEVLVFGGGVMASGEAVLGPIREYVHRHAWTPWGGVRVVASELEDDAALVACEWLVKEKR